MQPPRQGLKDDDPKLCSEEGRGPLAGPSWRTAFRPYNLFNLCDVPESVVCQAADLFPVGAGAGLFHVAILD